MYNTNYSTNNPTKKPSGGGDHTNAMDYPVAVASYVVDPDDHNRRPTLLQTGRSSRVVMPPQHASTKVLDASDIRTLQSQGYTSGLIHSMSKNILSFPLRIWVVDNSGSMTTGDGHRLIETYNQKDVKYVSCSRWAEMQETVEYHARAAALLGAPTVFRLLNDPGRIVGPQQFSIAERGPEFVSDDLNIALTTMKNASPTGLTPLSDHVREIRENILTMKPTLVSNGQRVVIVLATDGLPSDSQGGTSAATRSEFLTALRSLEGLPVWVVVRLCTDDDAVVEFYNKLDTQVEVSLEVIDDFVGEGKEVYGYNPWLNYSLTLHRIREMGFSHTLLDLLDERPLRIDELRDFLFLLFGPEHFDGVPDPQVDWNGFTNNLASILKKEKLQWNPNTKRMAPWIDMKLLNKKYSPKKWFW
jgi:hypothetical protein